MTAVTTRTEEHQTMTTTTHTTEEHQPFMVPGPRCDSCRFYDGRGGDRGVCRAASLTRDSRLYIDAWALTGGWGDGPEVRAELCVAPDHYCADWRPW